MAVTIDDSFRKIQPICLSVIQAGQTENWPKTSSALEELRRILEEIPTDHLLKEIHQFLSLPLRLLLKKEKCPESVTCSILDVLTLARSLCSAKIEQWTIARDFITQLLLLISSPKNADELRGSENLKIAVLSSISGLVSDGLTGSVKTQLYSEENRPFLGHFVYVILRLLEQEKSLEIGLICLEILRSLTNVETGENEPVSEAFASLLPGCLICLTKISTENRLHSNHKLVCSSLTLWKDLFLFVCGDLERSRVTRKECSNDSRNSNWFTVATQRASSLLTQLAKNSVNHANFEVRLCLLNCSFSLITECSLLTSECRNTLIDVIVTSVSDEYCVVSYRAAEILGELRSSDLWLSVYGQVEENFYQICTSLPRIVRQNEGTNGADRVFDQLIAYVRVLGAEGMRKICLSSAHLRRFTLALCQSIDFDVSQISMVSEIAETNDSDTVKSDCSKPVLPMKFIQNPAKIVELCVWVGKTAPISLTMDHLLDLIEEKNGYYERPALFLLNNLFSAPEIQFCSEDLGLVEAFAQSCLNRLKSLDLDLEVKDDRILDLSLSSTDDTVVANLTLQGVVTAASILKQNFRGSLLLSTLYPVLECSTSNQRLVSDTARWALKVIAVECGFDGVESLLLDNHDYLLFSISMSLRHLQKNSRSPLVFCSVLQNSGKEMLDAVKLLVYEVLMGVDTYHATSCFLLTKVLLEFARAVYRCFSGNNNGKTSLEQPSLENGEEKEGNKSPEHIQMVVQILKRTKHIVSSPHLPLRLVILDLIKASMEAVGEWENDLLPMIHQNWSGVLARFVDEECTVAASAFKVILCMARLSGMFVYRRVVDEFWPKIAKFLKKSLEKSANTGPIYQQTGFFRLQYLILCELGTLLELIRATEQDLEIASDVCRLYLGGEQPENLKQAASKTIEKLDSLGASQKD